MTAARRRNRRLVLAFAVAALGGGLAAFGCGAAGIGLGSLGLVVGAALLYLGLAASQTSCYQSYSDEDADAEFGACLSLRPDDAGGEDLGPCLGTLPDEGPCLEPPLDAGPCLTSVADEGPCLDMPADYGPCLEPPLDAGLPACPPEYCDICLSEPIDDWCILDCPTSDGGSAARAAPDRPAERLARSGILSPEQLARLRRLQGRSG